MPAYVFDRMSLDYDFIHTLNLDTGGGRVCGFHVWHSGSDSWRLQLSVTHERTISHLYRSTRKWAILV